jgi:hypothetical protein
MIMTTITVTTMSAHAAPETLPRIMGNVSSGGEKKIIA